MNFFNKALLKKALFAGSGGTALIFFLLSKYVWEKTITYSGTKGFKLTNLQEKTVKQEVNYFVQQGGSEWNGHYIPDWKDSSKWKNIANKLKINNKKGNVLSFNNNGEETKFEMGKEYETWQLWRDMCYSKKNWALNYNGKLSLVTGAILNFCTTKD